MLVLKLNFLLNILFHIPSCREPRNSEPQLRLLVDDLEAIIVKEWQLSILLRPHLHLSSYVLVLLQLSTIKQHFNLIGRSVMIGVEGFCNTTFCNAFLDSFPALVLVKQPVRVQVEVAEGVLGLDVGLLWMIN